MNAHRIVRSWRNALLFAAALAFTITGAAPAQFGEAAGFGEMMSPYFLRRDLEIVEQGLDLDEGQAVILESLYWDYEDEHDAGKARMLERLSNMRDELQDLDRDQVLQRVFLPFEERSEEWDMLREQFLENVKAILNSEQLEDWPRFRRQLRREKEIRRGRFSGESVDLFRTLRDAGGDEALESAARPVLEDYELAIDEALARRERLLNESRLAMMHAIRDDDPTSSLAIYERQIAARVAVRNVNDEYTIAIGSQLPADVAAEFLEQTRERAYPRVFRATLAERMFAEAKEIEELSDETLQAIENLEVGLLDEIAAINDVILASLHDYEPAEAMYRASSFAMRESGKRPDKPVDPTRDEFRRREEVGRRYIEQLRALLTPEQFRSLSGAQRFLRTADGAGGARKRGDDKRKLIETRQVPTGLYRDDD